MYLATSDSEMYDGSVLVRVCFVSAALLGRAHHVGARGQAETERVEQKERITWSRQGDKGQGLHMDTVIQSDKTKFVPFDVDPPV
jgi:hypothetical protein